LPIPRKQDIRTSRLRTHRCDRPVTVTSLSVTANPSSITTAQTSQCSATVTGLEPTAQQSHGRQRRNNHFGRVFTPSGAGTASCIANSTQAGYTNVSGSAPIAVTVPVTVTSVSVTANPSSITTAQTSQCSATRHRDWSLQLSSHMDATAEQSPSAGGLHRRPRAGTASCMPIPRKQDIRTSPLRTHRCDRPSHVHLRSVASCNPSELQLPIPGASSAPTFSMYGKCQGTVLIIAGVTWTASAGTHQYCRSIHPVGFDICRTLRSRRRRSAGDRQLQLGRIAGSPRPR